MLARESFGGNVSGALKRRVKIENKEVDPATQHGQTFVYDSHKWLIGKCPAVKASQFTGFN